MSEPTSPFEVPTIPLATADAVLTPASDPALEPTRELRATWGRPTDVADYADASTSRPQLGHRGPESARSEAAPTDMGPRPPEPPDSTPTAGRRAMSSGRAAAVGGLVGALLSSAVLGTALVATRKDNGSTKTATSQTAAATPSLVVAKGGTTTAGSITNITSLLQSVEPAVVNITTKGFDPNSVFGAYPQSGAGTGMVVSADGYIITNAHVVADANTIKVTFHDRKVRTARVIGADPAKDIALIKVDATGLSTVTFGSSKNLSVGEQVVAIGNALALPGGPTVTTGIVSAVDRTIEGGGERLSGLVQTDAAINPGNSGGPLVNSKGQVIGMNTAILSNSNNIGFAIASDQITSLYETLKKEAANPSNPNRPRTFLGVSTQTVSSDMKERFGLGTDKGVLVVDVTIGSAADNAGMKAGDVIVKFDGKAVTQADALVALVHAKKPADQVDVSWVTQDGRTINAKVELGQARRT